MKISPLDIHQKQFHTRLRGYDPEEVTTFLEMVRLELESLIRDNAQLKDSLKRAEAALVEFQDRDRALKDTLVLAQRMTEDIKAGALKEAEIVLSEARLQGEQIIAGAHARMSQLLEDIHDLRSQRSQLLAALRTTLDTHSRLLEITEQQSDRRDAPEEKFPPHRQNR